MLILVQTWIHYKHILTELKSLPIQLILESRLPQQLSIDSNHDGADRHEHGCRERNGDDAEWLRMRDLLLCIESIANGLGKANGELLGGVWTLLVSLAALRSSRLLKGVSVLGLFVI